MSAARHFQSFFTGTCLVLLSLAAFAQSEPNTKLFYFGGGGERGKSRNVFDISLEQARELAIRKNWDSVFQADIEHPSTRRYLETLSEKERSNIKDFSAFGFVDQIDVLTKQIEDGVVSSQVLVVIDTHGYERGSDGQNAISVSNGKANLTVPIQKLVAVAESKGIKLGLVLGNCYSGDLRRDFGQLSNVCVVTGSSANRVAKATEILPQMNESPNLEQAYLKSREKSWRSAETQPGISTGAGEKVDRDLSIYHNYSFYSSDRKKADPDRICENSAQKIEHIIALANEIKVRDDIKWFEFWKNWPRAAGILTEAIKERDRWLNEPHIPPDTGPWGISLSDCYKKRRNEFEFPGCPEVHSDLKANIQMVKDDIVMVQEDPERYFREPTVSGFTDVKDAPKELAYLRKKLRSYELELQDPKLLKVSSKIRAARLEVSHYKVKRAEWEKQQESAFRQQDVGLTLFERDLYSAFYEYYSKQEGTNPCREFKLK